LYEFESKWRQAGPGSVTCDTEHPGEAKIGENFRLLGVIGEKPSKLNAPFDVIGLMDDLFGA
jgi:hypothetical protein